MPDTSVARNSTFYIADAGPHTSTPVLEHGEIVERGTHTELLATGSVYPRLHTLSLELRNRLQQ